MNLIVCGDSWSRGAELKNHEKTFGELLAQDLACEHFFNCSLDASSIPHLVLQLKQGLEHLKHHNLDPRNTIVLFFLTGTDRDLCWSDTMPIGTGFLKSDPPPYNQRRVILLNPSDKLHQEWYEKYQSPELSDFRVNTTLLALQQICEKHGLIDRYIWGWHHFPHWPEIDLSRIYDQGHTSAAAMFYDQHPGPVGTVDVSKLVLNRNPYIWPNGGHPNQLGHQLIAQHLSNWIKKDLNTGCM